MAKLSKTYAAIAQQVERILGKDEVASSNLASSSKNKVIPIGMALFFSPLGFELAKPVKIWGAMGAPPVAGGATRTSGSGLQKTSLLRQAKFSQGTATG